MGMGMRHSMKTALAGVAAAIGLAVGGSASAAIRLVFDVVVDAAQLTNCDAVSCIYGPTDLPPVTNFKVVWTSSPDLTETYFVHNGVYSTRYVASGPAILDALPPTDALAISGLDASDLQSNASFFKVHLRSSPDGAPYAGNRQVDIRTGLNWQQQVGSVTEYRQYEMRVGNLGCFFIDCPLDNTGPLDAFGILDMVQTLGVFDFYEYGEHDWYDEATEESASYGVFFSGRATFNRAESAIPEPQVWALMIVGFGLVGAMLRRRVVAL